MCLIVQFGVCIACTHGTICTQAIAGDVVDACTFISDTQVHIVSVYCAVWTCTCERTMYILYEYMYICTIVLRTHAHV